MCPAVGACKTLIDGWLTPPSQEIKYFNFFVEGACYTFALDLIQETDGSHRSLPWIRSSIKCMQLLIKVRDPGASDAVQAPITIAALVRMVRSVIPEFAVDDSPPEFDDQILPLQRNSSEYSAGTAGGNAVSPAVAAAAAGAYAPITTPPTGRPLMPTTNNGMGPGNEASSTTPVTDNSSYAAAPGPPSQYPPTGLQHTDGDGSAYPPQQQPMMADPQMDDFAAMNMGLDFDFGITDMDAFLSIDPNQNWVFRP